jgi:hypothetical protein
MRAIADREDAHQAALFQWARVAVRQYPGLRMMYHVPNGGQRERAVAKKLAGQGVMPGVADVILDVPREGKHGLRIELKRPGKHSVSREQQAWIDAWNAQGYLAVVCIGWEHARDVIVEYLGGLV